MKSQVFNSLFKKILTEGQGCRFVFVDIPRMERKRAKFKTSKSSSLSALEIEQGAIKGWKKSYIFVWVRKKAQEAQD